MAFKFVFCFIGFLLSNFVYFHRVYEYLFIEECMLFTMASLNQFKIFYTIGCLKSLIVLTRELSFVLTERRL